MTSDDRLPFLSQIIAHPDDDNHRLIYADWLEERGDPRGEFIRVQCEYARTMPYTQTNIEAFQTARDLLAEHGHRWLTETGFTGLRDYEFSRGFVSKIELTAHKFLEEGESILSSTPLECVRLPYISAKLNQLIERGLTHRLRGIDLGGLKLSTRRVKRILDASPNLQRLLLRFVPYTLDLNLANAIMDGPAALSIEELNIEGASVAPTFIQALAGGGGLRQLRALRMSSEQLGLRIGDHFGKWQLPELKHLYVSGNLRIAEMAMLAKRSGFKRIEMGFGSMPAKGLQMMIDSGGFASAEVIALKHCDLSERAGIALLGSDLSACRHLHLVGNRRLSDACWMALLENETAGSVESVVTNTGTFSDGMFDDLGERMQFFPVSDHAEMGRDN